MLLLGSLLFTAGGLWMGNSGDSTGYFCAAFFGLGVPVACINLVPGTSYLLISPEGITMKTLFSVTLLRWEDADEFFVVSIKQNFLTVNKMVGFNYSASYPRHKAARVLASALADCEVPCLIPMAKKSKS